MTDYREDKINREINGLETRIEHDKIQLEFSKKKKDEREIERLANRIGESENDIKIWESLRAKS